jgi:uncharacterized membrane protein YkgB
MARGKEVIEGLQSVGQFVFHYGLVLVNLYIGLIKFRSYEAESIRKFTFNSPLTSRLHSVFSTQGVSNLFGVAEISIATLIALRPLSAKASAVGSAMAVGEFLTTLSFLRTTPGVWQEDLGFPYISEIGGFLLKDVILLGVSIWTLGDSLQALQEN